MWKKIAIISLFLWIGSIGFLTYRIYFGNAVEVDGRIEMSLAPEEKELVLGEMRILLEGLQGIISGLASENFKEVEIAARGNGMAMAQDINPALITKLPLDFKEMGMGVHKAFDDIANNIKGKNSKQILSEVDEIMNSCIACHAAYKITETKD
jgi:hypothetical protein